MRCHQQLPGEREQSLERRQRLLRHDIHGPFDHVLAFFFYLLNLLIVEALIRAQSAALPKIRLAATDFLLLGTYFTKLYWGPAILHRLGA